jgi:colanic acid biosynthesis glycosyl transferase WcaI
MLPGTVLPAHSQSMRILLLTQWFQPEPQFKGLPLAKALRDRGHDVEVLTGFPNYPGGRLYPGYKIRLWQRETMDGIPVTRAALYPSHDQSSLRRIMNYASFALSSALLALSLKRPDVVYVYCPPMTAAAGAIALRFVRQVPYVIDIQDLWPDTLASTGMVKDGVLLKLVGAWSAIAMRYAGALVVLSPGFKRRLEQRNVRCPVHVIPNWAHPEIEAQKAAQLAKGASNPKIFNILFAGNMGKAQALGTVIEAARRLKHEAPHIRFTMIGGGVEVDHLRAASEAAGTTNIFFLPPRPVRDMGPIFSDADALLVHLRDDPLFSITIPSKTQAYLAIGRPILMGVRGDAADMVEAANAGIAFTPENADSLAEAAIRLSSMTPAARTEMGQAGATYYEKYLAFQHGVERLEDVLSNVASITQP